MKSTPPTRTRTIHKTRASPTQTACHLCGLVVLAVFSTFPAPAQTPAAPPSAHLVEKAVQTGEPAQPEVRLLLRLPQGHSPENPTARGILAFCTWEKEDASLRKRLLSENDPMVAYARKCGFAVLTWNTATLWTTGKSFDQLSREERRAQDARFDSVARAWERGVNQICKEQNLPGTGFLLYGISRGAHWGGRLALRSPDRFLAVHIHVANSYEKALGSAAGPLWLVSTGDLDLGRDNALAFYRLCQSKKYPIVFKAANGLGHATSPEIERLRNAFFDYALSISMDPRGPAARMLSDLSGSGLVGDLLTQEVYHGEAAAVIPDGQRVPLPEEKLAKVWGFLRMK